jgi:SSS family solute:Na+ symporter
MYWKRATTSGVLAGLLAGTATSVFFYFNPDLRPFDMHEGVLGLIVHVPVLISVSTMTPIQNEKHLAGFFS